MYVPGSLTIFTKYVFDDYDVRLVLCKEQMLYTYLQSDENEYDTS